MASQRPPRLRDRAARTDANPDLVATAKLIRRMLPGDAGDGDDPSTGGDHLPERLGRRLTDLTPERPSVMREVGLAALQAWQALSEAQRRRRGASDTAILFTDLVGFSAWALDAGDEAAIALLRRVGVATEAAVSDHDGIVVKRLGDGTMAVFGAAGQAVDAAHDAQRRLAEIEVEGHSPELRAGIHLGRPRKVGKDYLGVDVNVAARVGDAARGGEVLISDPAREVLGSEAYRFGRRRPLKAAGAPEGLAVCPVSPS
jgi:adenylate cyclase